MLNFEQNPDAGSPHGQHAAPIPSRRLRVLAVTREPALRDRIGALLAEGDCEIASHVGSREALIEASDADIAVVDELQGDQSGFALAAELRRAQPDLQVIVVVRALGDMHGERRAVDLGQGPLQAALSLSEMLRRVVARAAPRRGVRLACRNRYALAMEAANDGLWDWDLRTNFMSFSTRWQKMLGLETDGVGNSPDEWFGRVAPEDAARVRIEMTRLLQGEANSVEFDCRMQHRDGALRSMEVRALSVRDPAAGVRRIAGCHTDVTEQRAAAVRLLHGALHDPLTNLPNRELFHDRLRRAFERNQRDACSRFAVLFVDIDRFKRINDSLGHQVGDELLLSIADRLRQCVRGCDTLARLGGDEFAILAEEVDDIAQVIALAERVTAALANAFHVNAHDIVATASIGIALGAQDYETAGDILRDADTAMYRAKSLGRARYEVFRGTMRIKAVEAFRCETELRRGLSRGEFVLFYEPVVNLASGQLAGLEAISRWRDPARGWVSSAHFARIAHETGLAAPLERWALGEACRQIHKWGGLLGESFAVRVNLTASFAGGGLVDTVKEALVTEHVKSNHLVVQIQEDTFASHIESRRGVLDELRAMQVRVCVGDFGTGRSSSHLRGRVPVDSLKLGRAFGHELGADDRAQNIVASIVTFCRELDIVAIADGVVNLEDAAELRRLGCSEAQGDVFSVAVPEAEAREMLLRSRNGGLWQCSPSAAVSAG